MREVSTVLLSMILAFLCTVEANAQDGKKKQTPAATLTTEALSPIISGKELSILSRQENVRILELGQIHSEFINGHIPGAQFVHWVDDITDPQEADRYNILKSGEEELFMRLGISNDTHVVLYDRLDSRIATRMFWMMKIFKHQKVQILDGGFSLWSKTNTPTKKNKQFPRGNYQIKSKDSNLIADLDYVKQRIKDRETSLIDGRPADQFSGKKAGTIFHTGNKHKRRGHIPGAVNILWKDNFNADGTFKSAEQLRALYAKHGVLESKEVITYCNEGLHAAPPWFVLTQIVKRNDVRLYDDSMAEWANTKEPMKTTEKPAK